MFELDLGTFLESSCSLQGLITKIFVYKNMHQKNALDGEFYEKHPNMTPDKVVKLFVEIMNTTTQRMIEIFQTVRQIRINAKEDDKKELTREECEMTKNQLPLLMALVQMIQESLYHIIHNKELESDIQQIVTVAETIKGSNISTMKKSEKQVKDRIEMIAMF